MTSWTVSDIPDQTGRTVLITGANSGLGLHSARTLAGKGARVLLACRSAERGRSALEHVTPVATTAPELITLDLADLGSVRKAADEIRETTGDSLDVLMNNAGVMATPQRTTADGFELQFGTNHLGHAALTWLLMPALRARPGARVVTLSSMVHHNGRIDFDDLNFESRRYTPIQAYAQSKLANLMFARELNRRTAAQGLDVTSVGAHPGMSATELSINTVQSRSMPSIVSKGTSAAARLFTKIFAQSVAQGSLPQLYAATSPDVVGGEYYGPDGFREIRGEPAIAKPSRAARDDDAARRLWDVTADLLDVPADPT